MTSNRPFLSNFLAAFRAHSAALPKAPSSIATSSAAAVAAAVSSAQPTTVWSSSSSSTTGSTQQTSNIHTAAASLLQKSQPQQITQSHAQTSTSSSSQLGQPTHLAPLQHNVSPRTHSPRSPPSPGGLGYTSQGQPLYGPQNRPQPSYPTPPEARQRQRQRHRRGSDSSSDGGGGFRDVLGGEKWYIGGRTAGGEERFYRLAMVRRDRSADRLSTDRLSL